MLAILLAYKWIFKAICKPHNAHKPGFLNFWRVYIYANLDTNYVRFMTQDFLMTRPARPFNVRVPSSNSIIDKTIQIQLQIFILGPSQSQTKYTCFTHYVPCIPWASVQLYCACNTVLLHNFEGVGGGTKILPRKIPFISSRNNISFPKIPHHKHYSWCTEQHPNNKLLTQMASILGL